MEETYRFVLIITSILDFASGNILVYFYPERSYNYYE